MAVLVSHAMRRHPTSPPDVYASCRLRGEAAHHIWLQEEETESSLSRSMRYADPWLYSNPPPGNLLLTPALVLCACPDYINGTKGSSKKSKSVCKKCKGTRLPFPGGEAQKFGTVRCYPTTHVPVSTALRAGTLRASGGSSRPTILPSDPYDFMRKSRLSVTKVDGKHKQQSSITSSSNGESRSKKSNGLQSRVMAPQEKFSTIGRKSILECDINPYELMCDENNEVHDSSITLVNGQRIRVKPPIISAPDYEDIEIKNDKETNKISAEKINRNQFKRLSSTQELNLNEKESESNRFKSILKKTATFSDTDSSNGPERSSSPAHKSGSHFYLPMPVANAPRKKVQFLVENERARQKQNGWNNEPKVQCADNIYEDSTDYSTDENSTSISSSDDDVDLHATSSCRLRRSVSERFIQDPPKVVFHDTMALRPKLRRNNLQETFTQNDLQRLDGIATHFRQNNLSKVRPKEPPPQPPPVDTDSKQKNINDTQTYVNKCNGEKTVALTKEKIASVNEQPSSVNNFNSSHNSEEKIEEDVDQCNLSNAMNLVPQCNSQENSINNKMEINNLPPSVPPRKRSNNKQPSIINTSPPPTINNTINTPTTVSITTQPLPLENLNKTIVQIGTTPKIHKIQIKNEHFPETNNSALITSNPQRKTSILINGDDCYCTVNVNDDVPLYHSSVVVKDSGIDTSEIKNVTRGGSISIITKDHVVINTVNNEQNTENISEQNKNSSVNVLVIKSSPDSTSNYDNMQNTKDNSTMKTEQHEISVKNNDTSDVKFEVLQKILKDPVEAVRRNLVPHVCGKSDVPRKMQEKNTQLIAETLKLKVEPTSTEEKPAKNSTETSFNPYKYEDLLDDDKDVGSEHSSSNQYEIMDLGSDCYTDNSNRSSITEEELANRTKFYELLADSAAIEVSENEDHHYESIKANVDPIYEEIEIPPPLPSNPPPASLLDDIQLDKEFTTRSIFEGASKYDILSYLVDAKERGIVQEDNYAYNFTNNCNTNDDEEKETTEPYNRVSHMSTVSDSSEENSLILTSNLVDEKQRAAEVERNDSGVGSETSKNTLSKYRLKPDSLISCEDCDNVLEGQCENEPLLCRKCIKKRSERKEIITEIVETEEKYSRDLQIILEEFYQPMLVAGLLTPEQLSAIFLNVEELLENSQALAERLRDAVEIAAEQGDEDLLTVNIGKLFLEAAPMLHGFESYCIRQGTASLLLASLEKDKELLRIFLRVSQMENTMLRRMNLNSFLMVPVQRVTKYPLLLARLHKVTPLHHETREQLKEAQHKIELHLNHMNSETKDVPSKLWRRISNSSGRRASTEMDLVNIKLRKLAVDVLEWNHDEAKFALEGKLLYTQPTDNNWRKGRTIKLSPINALLVTNGKTTATNRPERAEENGLVFPRHAGVREAALLLVRDKNGRYSLLREPLYLDRCVIAADPAWQSYFEVQELLSKDTFIFKAEDEQQTHMWYRQLQYHAQGMGTWRRRRNALANIMINGMGLRT